MNKIENISKQPQKKIENERRYQRARNMLTDGLGRPLQISIWLSVAGICVSASRLVSVTSS